ncbi:MAG: hypothetical protein ACI4KD_01510 [Oscillospiraceae bacterium]
MKEKVPFYEVANMFFTGAAFSVILILIIADNPSFNSRMSELLILFKDLSVVVSAALLVAMYEIGFILNKIGSVLLGKLLEKSMIWPRENYDISVSQLEEKNSKFKSLNIELHVTRTHIIMYLILCIVSLFFKKWILSAIFLIIGIILLFAGRRTNHFMNRIKEDYRKEIETTKMQI